MSELSPYERYVDDSLYAEHLQGLEGLAYDDDISLRTVLEEALFLGFHTALTIVDRYGPRCRWCDARAIGTAYMYDDHTYPDNSCGEHGFNFWRWT